MPSKNEKRVTVGIRVTHHTELVQLCELTGQTISAIMDEALRNYLEDVAPVWRRAAEQLTERKKKSKI